MPHSHRWPAIGAFGSGNHLRCSDHGAAALRSPTDVSHPHRRWIPRTGYVGRCRRWNRAGTKIPQSARLPIDGPFRGGQSLSVVVSA